MCKKIKVHTAPCFLSHLVMWILPDFNFPLSLLFPKMLLLLQGRLLLAGRLTFWSNPSSVISMNKLFLLPVTAGKVIVMSQVPGRSATHRMALNCGKGSFFLCYRERHLCPLTLDCECLRWEKVVPMDMTNFCRGTLSDEQLFWGIKLQSITWGGNQWRKEPRFCFSQISATKQKTKAKSLTTTKQLFLFQVS